MLDYDWPGNVRELENCIKRGVAMSPSDSFSREMLPADLLGAAKEKRQRRRSRRAVGLDEIARDVAEFVNAASDAGAALDDLKRIVEETVLRRFIETGVSQRELARRLGISRTTLRKRLPELGLG